MQGQAIERVDLTEASSSEQGHSVMSDHEDVVARIAARVERQGFRVQTRNNNLPPGSPSSETIYRPDIIVRNHDNQIAWLFEVETSEAGKAVAGAAILADICMEKMNVKSKPKLLFVFYRSKSNLKLAEKRLLAMKDRIKYIEVMPPLSETEAIASLS
jgi:hypothetical protein